MQIKKLKQEYINELVELWYEASVKANDFIDAEYWEGYKEYMAEVNLPFSETYIGFDNSEIVGFVSMMNDFMHALFVKTDLQGKGYGKKLLEYVKENRTAISTNVFRANKNATGFYEKNGFITTSTDIEEETDEFVLLMEWEK